MAQKESGFYKEKTGFVPRRAARVFLSIIKHMENRYTDGTYLAANPSWHGEDSAWKLAHVRRALKSAGVAEARLKTVCDVGCGAGEAVTGLVPPSGRNLVTHFFYWTF